MKKKKVRCWDCKHVGNIHPKLNDFECNATDSKDTNELIVDISNIQMRKDMVDAGWVISNHKEDIINQLIDYCDCNLFQSRKKKKR